MKVMVMVKATPSSETGKLPSMELLNAMGNYNQELVEAGIMQVGEGLKASSQGFRIRFSGKERTVTRGPFAETNELVAGYWIWQVSTLEEAIEWVKKCPNPMEEDSVIEIRPVFEMEDFAEIDCEGKVAAEEKALREKIAMQQAKVNHYIFFSGNCETALEYYQAHLGAKVKLMLRFGQCPEPLPEQILEMEFKEKIMHSEFTIGDTRIFASDGCSDSMGFSGFSLALTLAEEQDVRRVFNALADGGTITMPLDKTFFAPLYGQVTDRFGVAWMIMLPPHEG